VDYVHAHINRDMCYGGFSFTTVGRYVFSKGGPTPVSRFVNIKDEYVTEQSGVVTRNGEGSLRRGIAEVSSVCIWQFLICLNLA
jgi:hypothetical protein